MKHIHHHIKSTPILDLYADQADDFLNELDQRVHNHAAGDLHDSLTAWIN